MNIQEAKKQIKQTVRTYLMKNSYGDYYIPIERQRPVFLIGAPGIGKTAIVEQIAQEMDIALVTYSMTHHTRQSALGLPMICHRTFQDVEYDVSEYTMSEIIATVYETMEQSGKSEGILFLDEINCVSETLAPSMLQFLQYKVFGKHKVPDGWVVVTAGNPPQFNKSVREFDIVTMDRLKILNVEPDYSAWREYASSRMTHSSILTYLEIKKDDFYLVDTTVEGKTYVTARGWEDLSEMIYMYEKQGYEPDETLVSQYLHNKRIARDFAAYYDIFRKYREDYKVYTILDGQAGADICSRAQKARFDERTSLMGLLLDAVQMEIRKNIAEESRLRDLFTVMKKVKFELTGDEKNKRKKSAEKVLNAQIDEVLLDMERKKQASLLPQDVRERGQDLLQTLRDYVHSLKLMEQGGQLEAYAVIKQEFDDRVKKFNADTKVIMEHLDNLFAFVEANFGVANEMLILVTNLTVDYNSAKFIDRNGCEKYYEYNEKFQLFRRQQDIDDALESIDLEQLEI